MLEESETPQSETIDAAPSEPEASAAPSEDTIDVADVEAVIDLDAGETPDVDELQGRLADLQGAMDQLQSGDLDGAEATIASLEKAMAAAKDPAS